MNVTVRQTRSSTKKSPKREPNQDKTFVRVTRSMSKNLNTSDKKTFTIVEVYRCMPLLGGEENIPNWQVHIVKYSIEFVKN